MEGVMVEKWKRSREFVERINDEHGFATRWDEDHPGSLDTKWKTGHQPWLPGCRRTWLQRMKWRILLFYGLTVCALNPRKD